MKTLSKAISLLAQFSVSATPKALGAIAADARLDKATTRRMLLAMMELGLIEQNPNTRDYTLGAAVLPLARAREALYPLQSIAETIIGDTADATGETTHFSVPAQNGLSVLRVIESPHTIRVHIAEGSMLPLHSSGGGIAYLSTCDDTVIERVLSADLPRFTKHSYDTPIRVRNAITKAKTLGYAVTSQTLEEGVTGIAMPVLRGDGLFAGVIGVATPSDRMNAAMKEKIVACLSSASQKMASMI